MPSVIITGADRGLGLSLCKEYLRRGWVVFAGKYMKEYNLLEDLQATNANLHIVWLDMGSAENITAAASETAKILNGAPLDMLISNAALMGEVDCRLRQPPMNLEAVWTSFRVNALGPVLLTEALLPQMEGGLQRLCYVSSEVSCLDLKHRYEGAFPYPLSKTAMNMGIRTMHNDLHPKGFTFRLFHPGWMKFRMTDGSLTETARFDPDYIGERAVEYFDTPLPSEHRLVMVDFNGYEWPY